MSSIRLRLSAVSFAVLLALTIIPLQAPAASPIVLPMYDSFTTDTIGGGVWDIVTTGAPVAYNLSNGNVTLKRITSSIGQGGGGLSRPWGGVDSSVVLEVRMTPRVVYRFGIGLMAPDGKNTLFEADDLGFLLAYQNSLNQRQFHHLPVAVTPNVEYVMRLTIQRDGAALAEVFNAAMTTRLGAAASGQLPAVKPLASGSLIVNVWRDNTGNPMSEYQLHEVGARIVGGPAAPTGLAATTGPASGEITLAWNASTNATSYRVYGGNVSGLATTLLAVVNSTTFVERGLGFGVQRHYQVSAVGASGEGARSAEVAQTTFQRVGPPVNVTATPGNSTGSVVVSWDEPVEPGGPEPVTYVIERVSSGLYDGRVGTTSARTITDGRMPTGTYTYVVSARKANATSPPSAPANATIDSRYPGIVTDLVATAERAHGEVLLTWTPPIAGREHVTGYEVIEIPVGAPHRIIALDDANASSAAMRFRPAGDYGYFVRAVNADLDAREAGPAYASPTAPWVAALGDSVGAGHGVGYSKGFPNNPGAHPRVLGEDLLGGYAYDFAFSGACAGSVETGAPRTSENCDTSIIDDQLPLLHSYFGAADKKPSIITISTGGNDIDFSGCFVAFLSKAERGPCESGTLAEHLAAYEDNMDTVIADIRARMPDTPIALTQYYNPFPITSAGHKECGVWSVAAAVKLGPGPGSDDHPAWRWKLAAIQAQAELDVNDIMTNLNNAIANVAARHDLILVPVDFTGHDMCRADRDPGAPENETWVFGPELRIAAFVDPCPFFCEPQGIDHSFGPAPGPVPDSSADPADHTGSFDLGLWSGAWTLRVNGMPHPTATGQAKIAEAILAQIDARGMR